MFSYPMITDSRWLLTAVSVNSRIHCTGLHLWPTSNGVSWLLVVRQNIKIVTIAQLPQTPFNDLYTPIHTMHDALWRHERGVYLFVWPCCRANTARFCMQTAVETTDRRLHCHFRYAAHILPSALNDGVRCNKEYMWSFYQVVSKVS